MMTGGDCDCDAGSDVANRWGMRLRELRCSAKRYVVLSFAELCCAVSARCGGARAARCGCAGGPIAAIRGGVNSCSALCECWSGVWIAVSWSNGCACVPGRVPRAQDSLALPRRQFSGDACWQSSYSSSSSSKSARRNLLSRRECCGEVAGTACADASRLLSSQFSSSSPFTRVCAAFTVRCVARRLQMWWGFASIHSHGRYWQTTRAWRLRLRDLEAILLWER